MDGSRLPSFSASNRFESAYIVNDTATQDEAFCKTKIRKKCYLDRERTQSLYAGNGRFFSKKGLKYVSVFNK